VPGFADLPRYQHDLIERSADIHGLGETAPRCSPAVGVITHSKSSDRPAHDPWILEAVATPAGAYDALPG
jgi:hypothetical protein